MHTVYSPSSRRGCKGSTPTIWQPIADTQFTTATTGSAMRVNIDQLAELAQRNPPPTLLVLLVFADALQVSIKPPVVRTSRTIVPMAPLRSAAARTCE